ncbi:MAG: DUF4199 domain-containing protein [Saprospirales bacterium]|nr:DUF4199 domain-containing protein [Saprospirales bacterium]MBK8490294.1 DUF4199 domain-containing protein [Saprospirales bacterium]
MSNLDEPLMQPESVPMRPLALRYGLLTALALFVVGLGMQFSGLVDPVAQKGTAISSVITLLIFFGGIFIATREYKRESGNTITFGRALGFGTLTVAIVCLVGMVLNYLHFTLIDPGMIDQIRAMSMERMEEQGLDEAAMEQAIKFANMFTNPISMSIFGAISSFIFGFIVSLITSAIHQNAKATEAM